MMNCVIPNMAMIGWNTNDKSPIALFPEFGSIRSGADWAFFVLHGV
jgi:hypothetical protein